MEGHHGRRNSLVYLGIVVLALALIATALASRDNPAAQNLSCGEPY